MQPLVFACLSAIILVIAIFLAGDADLTVLFAPAVPEDGFKDKVVWVTGASSGIGAALAMELVNMNAKVVLSARRADKLNEIASQCRGDHKPLVLPLDMVSLDAHQAAYDTIVKEFGRVDIIVLNAGRSQRNPAVDTKFEDTKALMDLNFLSYVHLTKTALPNMIANGSGQLVLMSSLSGHISTPVASSYSASKFAMHGYFDALRAEIADTGVSVSVICPGPVESDIHLHTVRADGREALSEGTKMSTLRFVNLALRGIYHRLDEMWISDQPYLLLTYTAVYAPWINRKLLGFVGPKRVKILREGGNVYDIKKAFGS